MSVTRLSRKDAAILIQKQCRGRLERLGAEKLQAIIVIQNFWRSHLAQREVEERLLPRPLFEKAVTWVDQVNSLPRSKYGNTPVYYLPGIPVVAKRCGSSKKIEQLAEMSLARQICIQKGFQHVVVPLARTEGNFLFAQRIHYSSKTKVQVGFYMKYYQCFTLGVKEFSTLYFSTTIPDLVDLDCRNNPYKSVCSPPLIHPFCRYDNLALYLDQGVGKIGLVDLQGFTPVVIHSSALYLQKCHHLVGMFPRHLDEIFAIAKQLDKQIEKSWSCLLTQQEKTLTCFNKIYTEHLQFVQRAEISLRDPARFDFFSPEITEQLRLFVNALLCAENTAKLYRHCLGENPETTLKQFNSRAFPSIIKAIHQLIATALIEQAKQHEAVESLEELLSIRTLIFSLSKEIWKIKHIAVLLDMFFISEEKRISFLKCIVFFLLNGLVKFQVVAYYNCKFGFPPKQAHCLFC